MKAASKFTGKRAVDYWVDTLRQSPYALVMLFFLSAFEATLIPVPLELILIPYMMIERQRIWLISSVALLGCLTGAMAGYWVGVSLFDSIGQWLIGIIGGAEAFGQYMDSLDEEGFVAIFMVGITPVPFQFAMLGAGATGYPLLLFMLASALSRGIRYYGLAALVLLFGDTAAQLWKKHARAVGVSVLMVFVIGFLVYFL